MNKEIKNLIIEGKSNSPKYSLSTIICMKHPEYTVYDELHKINYDKIKRPFVLITNDINDIDTKFLLDNLKNTLIFPIYKSDDVNDKYRLIYKTVFNKELKINKNECTCSSLDLFRYGCQCSK